MAAIPGIQTSSVNTLSFVNPNHSMSASNAVVPQQPAARLSDDTVKLSLAAHIKQMHLQGYSPSVIASQLGISVKQLSTYLPGLSQAPAVASKPAATSSIHPQPQVLAPVQATPAE